MTAPAPDGDAPDDAWSWDRLLGGRLLVRQPRAGYRIAVDTLLLAAAVPARPDALLVELGAGVGGASLAVARRVPGARVVAVERDPVLAGALAANIRVNGLTGGLHPVVADVARLPLATRPADVVFFNPPYATAGTGTAPTTDLGRRARREDALPLARWIEAARGLLRPSGDLVLVHRADRLADVLAGLAGLPTLVLPLWPRRGGAARRVLVRARPHRKGGVRLLPGLVLHDREGHFTPEADAVLRDAAELSWE